MRSKQVVISILFLFYLHLPVNGMNNMDNNIPKYDLYCAGVGNEGTYLAIVSIYLPKANLKTDEILRKAAVHGVIFKGISGKQGCNTQRPLANNPTIEDDNVLFFNGFFKENGTYLQYAVLVDGSLSVTKISKKEYCITATVSIQKDQLRKYLEQEKIITGFSDMF